jgi:hypothetical protein
MALPADPGALQGWDPSLAIVDELHVVTDDTYEAMAARAGKREHSLLLAISTPPKASQDDSVMRRLVDHGRARHDPSFYFAEFAAPGRLPGRRRAGVGAGEPGPRRLPPPRRPPRHPPPDNARGRIQEVPARPVGRRR